MKTTLRYLLIVVAILSVLGVSAQTPQYGKSYKPENKYARVTTQTDAQLPAATMGTVDAAYMHSGSNLPMAAQSGVTTTYDTQDKKNLTSRRRGLDDDDDEEKPGGWDDPYKDPLGDVMWPLAMFALAYAFGKWIAKRTKPLR